MTAADALLASLAARASAFAVCRVAPGWRLRLGAASAPLLHYVLRGSGVLRLAEGAAIPLSPHGLVLLPPGCAHALEVAAPDEAAGVTREAAGPESCAALADGLLRFTAGAAGTVPGGGELVSACGTVEATYAGSRGLFDRLAAPLLLRLDGTDPLRQAFEAMLGELAAPALGTHALVEALLKQCLVLLVRRLDPAELARLLGSAGAADPRLVAAVRAMLEHPSRPFTLEGLAAELGMSRSGFAAHFHAAFGQPPMEFLREVRLRHAARLLETTDLPVATIARCVGYESRSYFSRAFRTFHGTDPHAFATARRRRGG